MSLDKLIHILPHDILIKHTLKDGDLDLIRSVFKSITKDNKFIDDKYHTSLTYHRNYLFDLDKFKVISSFIAKDKLAMIVLQNLHHNKLTTDNCDLVDYILNIADEFKLVLNEDILYNLAYVNSVTDITIHKHISRTLLNKSFYYNRIYDPLVERKFIKCIKLLLTWKIQPYDDVELVKLAVEMKNYKLFTNITKAIKYPNSVAAYVSDLSDQYYFNYIIDNFEFVDTSEYSFDSDPDLIEIYIHLAINEDTRIDKVKIKPNILDKLGKELLKMPRLKAQRIFCKHIKTVDEYDHWIVKYACLLGLDSIAIEEAKKNIHEVCHIFNETARLDLLEHIISISHEVDKCYTSNYWYSYLADEYNRYGFGMPIWPIVFKIYPPENVEAWRVVQSAMCSASLYEALMERRYKVETKIINNYIHGEKSLLLVKLADKPFDLVNNFKKYSTAKERENIAISFMFWYPEYNIYNYGFTKDDINSNKIYVNQVRELINNYLSLALTNIICQYM